MKTVSLFFQVHHPYRLKTYRFFNMGKDHNYLDDSVNRSAVLRLATNSFLPMNEVLAKQIKANKGKFKVSFYISGIAVEQFKAYAPQVLDSFRELAETGCVEFVAGTYSNSLAALTDMDEFRRDVKQHTDMIKKEFGQKPTCFFDTAMLYSDAIGNIVAEMGFKSMITEGAKHVLGWKSPNYIYANALNQKLRLVLRNYRLSDDIAFRFSDNRWSEWPLTADKYVSWIEEAPGETINISMGYEALGEINKKESGIFDFMSALPKMILNKNMSFATVSESAAAYQPVGILHSDHALSWADEERDITAWLGNELQNEAFQKLYTQLDKVRKLNSPDFNFPWQFLQTADNFYYMGTKWFCDGTPQCSANPYGSSYEAFINYMNILSDFINELDKRLASTTEKEEIAPAKKSASQTAAMAL